MIYVMFAVFVIAIGIVLSRYELVKARRERAERLRDRARRCVRNNNSQKRPGRGDASLY